MDLSSLVARLAPPPPSDGGDRPAAPAPVPVDWDAVEGWLGLRLPADYKALVSARGPLDIGGHLWLHAPCAREDRFDYGDWLWETHRECRISSRRVLRREPPPFHPAPGGLLAWGETRGGVRLFWDTGACGDPDRWPVIVFDGEAARGGTTPWHAWGTTLTETVPALLGAGLPLPGGRTLGPLPPTARRPAFLAGAGPWAPPGPEPEPEPERAPGAVRRAAPAGGGGLEALSLLVAPPRAPYLGGGTWERLFEELGTRLPGEYVALMERYGAGRWGNRLGFLPPLRTAGGGFAHRVRQAGEAHRGPRAGLPGARPPAVWPEPGGFLPFAVFDDGDRLGWLTRGEPDDWPLAVWRRRTGQDPPLPGGLADTLLEWLRGGLRQGGPDGLLGGGGPLESAVFTPWGDGTHR